MKRISAALIMSVALLMSTATAFAAPVTKQNGKAPAFNDFTSICAVSGYANYGECGGDVTKFTGASGKINVVQAKADRYNLGFEFKGLEPQEPYTLHANNGSWLLGLASGVADSDGRLKLSWQANGATLEGIGFDLNHNYGTTILTSYWTGQLLHVTPSGMVEVIQYPLRDSASMTVDEQSRWFLATETIGADSFVAFDTYTPSVTVVANGLVPSSVAYVGYIETSSGVWNNLGSVPVDGNGYAKAAFLLAAAQTYNGYFAINNASGTQFVAGPFEVATH